MKKISTLRFTFLVFTILLSAVVTAQTPTDGDYRSTGTGLWSTVATWQVRNLSTWAAAATPPTPLSNVYVQAAHTITVDVATVACNDIHINSAASSVIAIGVNTTEVNGKLRAYTGTAVTTLGADGTFYSAQTSTAAVGASCISSTAGSGKMRFVGSTRTITVAGEWGNNPQAWDVEFAPTAGGTLTLLSAFKARNITTVSGTILSASTDFRPDGNAAGAGTLTIKNSSKLQFSATSINIKRIATAGATSHFNTLSVEAGGTLEFSGTSSPVIGASNFLLNGTVIYSGAGAQTLAAKGANSAGADATTYTNLILSNSGVKTISASLVTTINGALSMQGTATMALGTGATLAYGAAGILEYKGSAAQTITATPAEWPTTAGPFSLTIDNTNGVTLNATGGRAISGALTLNNGILTTTTLLTMNAGSTLGAAISNASFVDGKIKKVGSTSFIFPVGKASIGYAPIGIAALSASDEFTAEYIRSSAAALGGVTGGLDHVSSVDYWTLDRLGSATADVTLYWTTQSSSNGAANYISLTGLPSLALAHYDGASWNSFYQSAGAATGNSTAGNITWPAVNTFSPFSLGSIDILNPLPINISYLNGTKQNGSHNLNWKVNCTSSQNVIMAIERSADTRNFKTITSITADGVRCLQPFAYTDNAPLSGNNYYRLKTVDENGKITYSTIVLIINKETGFDIAGILPSIINNNAAVLNASAAKKMQLTVVVTDMLGKQVQQVQYNLIAGSNQITINFSKLAAGTYQLVGYTTEGKSKTIRFVKQ
jgi:hypothetical protein